MTPVVSDYFRELRATVHDMVLAGGHVRFYSGVMPAEGAPAAGDPVAMVDLPDPAGSVADGAFTLVPELSALVLLSDTISWARFTDADDTWLYDMDCGLAGSGALLILDRVDVQAGATLTVESLVLSEP